MKIVDRYLVKVSDPKSAGSEDPPKRVEEFRDQAAWVLLGEPGAGKSTLFREEAKISGGLCLSIAEFLHSDIDPDWQGKILFLDGLDEIRAGAGADSILIQVRVRLKRLGNPKFRIACRAADWFGSTDSEEIRGASPDGQILILQLMPLGREDILNMLRENLGVLDPRSFVDRAGSLGVASLLDNPQTLALLVQSIRGNEWPTSRQDTFKLACQQLADEPNKRHRNLNRQQPISVDKLLDAAGQICAVLLFSDKAGLALDSQNTNDRYSQLNDCSPPDFEIAQHAVRRMLFRPEGEEKVVPSHRTIAEYLAARWLASQIDRHGLPLGRVLNLLLGRDGRTVAGLRGLYGWLALHCHAARPRLIDADPLTVIVYGDVRPMPAEDKRRALDALRREANNYTGFRWDVTTTSNFGTLADPALFSDFAAALKSTNRDEASQSFADCVLEILDEGDPISGLKSIVKDVILDDTRWSAVRHRALAAWLKCNVDPQEAIALLEDIMEGRVPDGNDELAGLLLAHLYPDHIAPDRLLRYLHGPKDEDLSGTYIFFWGYHLVRNIPEAHLPAVLDQLASRKDLFIPARHEFHFQRMMDELLVRGLELHGTSINDDRLFTWLGIGADEYGEVRREESDRQRIARWFESHPERYKSLLELCDSRCEGSDNPRHCLFVCENRLHNAPVPSDIALWHLSRVTQVTNEALSRAHLDEAVAALIRQRGSDGVSIEVFEQWGRDHPEKSEWLKPLLYWEIPDWRREQGARNRARERERFEAKRQRTVQVMAHLSEINEGRAAPSIMYQLAGVWMSRFMDIPGETVKDRFDNYSENGQEVLAAAESGFFLCPERSDLPTVSEIIDLNINKKEHLIRLPCLIGMELRWKTGRFSVDSLPEDVLGRMLAFRLTYAAEGHPEWFSYFVVSRPALVAQVLVQYANSTFKSKQDYVDSIYPLRAEPTYAHLARLSVPRLLERFPLRARSSQHHYLESLLKAALQYSMEELPTITEQKLSVKGMDIGQRVYWLTIAMLLNQAKNEAALWRYIGKSAIRVNYLSVFLSEKFPGLGTDYDLPPRTIGKLFTEKYRQIIDTNGRFADVTP